jgi:hypothetical protein
MCGGSLDDLPGSASAWESCFRDAGKNRAGLKKQNKLQVGEEAGWMGGCFL